MLRFAGVPFQVDPTTIPFSTSKVVWHGFVFSTLPSPAGPLRLGKRISKELSASCLINLLRSSQQHDQIHLSIKYPLHNEPPAVEPDPGLPDLISRQSSFNHSQSSGREVINLALLFLGERFVGISEYHSILRVLLIERGRVWAFQAGSDSEAAEGAARDKRV